RYIILLTLSIAFLISVRAGGLIIYPYIILFAGTWILLKNQLRLFLRKNRKTLLRLVVQFAVVLSGGYLLGLLFWPLGLIRPLSNPLESLSVMEDYSILIRQIFEGNWYWSKSLPSYYLPKWLLISLPVFILVGLILYGLHFIVNYKKISYAELIVLFTLIFPLAYVILIRSNLYSGWRQMYFVAGHIAVLFAIGSESMVDYYRGKKVIAIIIAALLLFTSLLPMIHYVRNPGTAYVYFNAIAGGNKHAWGNYEYDYYWHGMKEATLWFDEHIQQGDDPIYVASNFNISLYLKHRPDIDVRYVHYNNRSKVPWEYGIFGINYIHPDQLKNDRWKPTGIVKIFRDGYNNPLAVVIKRENTNDLEGIRSARLENCNHAIELLNEAIKNDPNNFVLYEYLGECYYNRNDTLITQRFIEKAKSLHPWSEKINMIDAQLDYDRGNYEVALKKCLNIVENNNKYHNIVPLLISCYEKTGNSKMADFYRAKFLNLQDNKNGN
ncbi:MAG: tetratricopeptide repeat protein, partial [Lentisphaerae bacterium]|nr:tetratricopeptide repeat protein [Lentisphaerota bacterium]